MKGKGANPTRLRASLCGATLRGPPPPEAGMTLVEKYFFTPIYYPRSTWSVIRWWESRRCLYNLSVGATGLLTLATATVSTVLPPHSVAPRPQLLVAVMVYGIMANFCYCLGAPIDLMLRRYLRAEAPAVGQALFRYGFAFAIGLTLLPAPLFVVAYLLKWLAH
jgi:hypothetical protein